jgi:type IV pilus assembly protein PilY1
MNIIYALMISLSCFAIRLPSACHFLSRHHALSAAYPVGKFCKNSLVYSALLIVLWGQGLLAFAQSDDLARAPLNFLVATQAKPNIFFILDDSGSMHASALGDEVIAKGYQNTIGYRSSLCNKIYYDPSVTYPVPVRHDGTDFPNQNFGGALYNGFSPTSEKINLSSQFMAWRSLSTIPAIPADTETTKYRSDCFTALASSCAYDAASAFPNIMRPAHYFIYKGGKPANLGDDSADDHCKDTAFDTSAAGRTNWIEVVVSNTSGPGGTDERQNFANWFSYHRTRMLTMKTAVGLAFREMDGQYRVGYSTIGYSGAKVDHPDFLKIDDFLGAHRKAFYDRLYANHPVSSTPLRAALAKAGRLYAGKILTGENDPVRFSCQQNFAILSTDGYWNSAWEAGEYGPKKIDGQTNVGDQDHHLPPPFFDGGDTMKKLRVSTMVIEPQLRGNANFTIVDSIKIGGKEIMGRIAGVVHNGDQDAEAVQLAYAVSIAVNQNKFRAVSQDNKIFIIAPDHDDSHLEKPEWIIEGPFRMTTGPFEELDRRGRKLDTLADVAAYYYRTDLRSPELGNCRRDPEVCTNNVPSMAGRAGAHHQHMTTHALGLGASGTLQYQENYAEATEGDFRDIVDGKRGWPDPIFFPGPERIDDLWHAAVNGGGRYFNASNPQSLVRALSSTMSEIRAATGAAAASATSSQEPAEGDNVLFASSYRSIYWDGELEARKINLDDGSISATPDWSARHKLNGKVNAASDTRVIYFHSPAAASGLKPFQWSNLDATEQAYFSQLCASPARLSQCASLSDDDKRQITGPNVVKYLRGQRQHEMRVTNARRLFRSREYALGALINAPPLYVGRPAFRYADENYGAFRDVEAAKRIPVVYLAANDGMLHAINAGSGEEIWAFIPPGVLPHLWRSADNAFGNNFTYLLDGSPVAADICPSMPEAACSASAWRTVLITGLGAAGREYFALDITDPISPKFLWRFSVADNQDLGYSLGKAVVTKRRDGTWVVVVASGYRNVNPGTGQGKVFVLNAHSGKLLDTIETGSGSADEPSGLAHLNAWVDSPLDNTAVRFYGADLLGNLWRIDIDNLIPPAGKEAHRLAQFVRDGKVQPVTTRVELSEIRSGNSRIPVVTVGTGRLLSVADVGDQSVQSLYTLKDTLSEQSHGDVRTAQLLVERKLLVAQPGERSVSGEPVDWGTQAGWYLDFNLPDTAGERVSIDPEQQLGAIRIVTNVPDADVCRPAAQSWLYLLDFQTGMHVPSAARDVAGWRVFSYTLAAGARTIKIGERTISLVTNDSGSISVVGNPVPVDGKPTARRVSWQELDEQ